MASSHNFEEFFTDTTSDEEEEDEEVQEEEALQLNKSQECMDYISSRCPARARVSLDPRSQWFQEWNRVFLLVCATGLFIDPLFFYTFSISETCMCVFVDGWFAVTVTVLRSVTDALHVWNMWLQLKMSRWWRSPHHHRGLNHDGGVARKVAARIIRQAKKGFFFDLFVILPIPQVPYLFLHMQVLPYA